MDNPAQYDEGSAAETSSSADMKKTYLIKGLHEQMMEDIKSENWENTVELMKRHLNDNSQAYKQLNNITDYYYYLEVVASEGYTELLQIMLNNGLPTNIILDTDTNQTLFHKATRNGQYNIVQMLIEHGADLNETDTFGFKPLHHAVYSGNLNTVKLLLDKGADINHTNNKGVTPLQWAAFHGYQSIVQLLGERGADINSSDISGFTALHWAAEKGHKSVVQWLVDNGCDITIRDEEGDTAKDIAKTEEIKEIIKGKEP